MSNRPEMLRSKKTCRRIRHPGQETPRRQDDDMDATSRTLDFTLRPRDITVPGSFCALCGSFDGSPMVWLACEGTAADDALLFHRACLDMCGGKNDAGTKLRTVRQEQKNGFYLSPVSPFVKHDEVRSDRARSIHDQLHASVRIHFAEPAHDRCAWCRTRPVSTRPYVSFVASPNLPSMWFHDDCLHELIVTRSVLKLSRMLRSHFGRKFWKIDRLNELMDLRYWGRELLPDPEPRALGTLPTTNQ